MENKKVILIINGSASEGSSNQRLVDTFSAMMAPQCETAIFPPLRILPHFDPARSVQGIPEEVRSLHRAIAAADAVVFFTPEYIFSVPAGLKNALEWCVATTVFSDKPTGIITASAHGQKGHEALQLILKTLGARLSEETGLLIQGVKGKVNEQGVVTDQATALQLQAFATACLSLLK